MSPSPPVSRPGGSREQLGRLLTLVPFLASRGEVRVEEAAAALQVSPTQLVKDLKVLLMCGLPDGYPDDLIDVDLEALEGPDADGVIRVSNADYLSRPLRLTATEATALIVALRTLRAGAGEETREIVDRALAKLEAAAADGPAVSDAVTRIEPGADGADTEIALLATRLQQAARDRRQVRLTYYVPSRDEESERVVDPRGVVPGHGVGGGVPYLDAWCHTAEAPRLFRLDRVGRAEVLDSAITTEPEEPRDLTEGIFARSAEATTATVRVSPEAAWITEYYPVASSTALPDGRTEVELLVADPRWLTRLLLRLAPHVEVVAPASAGDDLTAVAQQALALYDSHGVVEW